MSQRGFLTISGSSSPIVKIQKGDGEFGIKYLSSLVLPFIESYWVTVSFLANMTPSLSLTHSVLE